MNLREIADAIEQTKAGYFAEIVGDVDKAKSEVWEIAHDSTRSTDWVKEQTDKAMSDSTPIVKPRPRPWPRSSKSCTRTD